MGLWNDTVYESKSLSRCCVAYVKRCINDVYSTNVFRRYDFFFLGSEMLAKSHQREFVHVWGRVMCPLKLYTGMYWFRLVVTTLTLKASNVGVVTMVAGSWFQM